MKITRWERYWNRNNLDMLWGEGEPARHLRYLSQAILFKKLRFLINHAHLRVIVKCYNQGLFANDNDVLHVVYNEIVQRGLRDTPYFNWVRLW